MPATQNESISVFALNPASTSNSTERQGLDHDHHYLFLDFTLGSLTNTAVKPQFSLDGSTWYDVYDAALTQIIYTWTATTNYAFPLGSNNTNSRQQPLVFCVPLWRYANTISGTATSSVLTLKVMPFVVGGVKD